MNSAGRYLSEGEISFLIIDTKESALRLKAFLNELELAESKPSNTPKKPLTDDENSNS